MALSYALTLHLSMAQLAKALLTLLCAVILRTSIRSSQHSGDTESVFKKVSEWHIEISVTIELSFIGSVQAHIERTTASSHR